MALSNVALTDTFDLWRTRTNQLVVQSNVYENDMLFLYNKGNNSPSYAYANNLGVTANAFASATIAGANTAVGAGANAFSAATIAGANNYLLAVIAGANTAVGAGANNFAKATIAGANTAVGAGANAFAAATIAGANTAVGAGANAYALSISSTSGVSFTATLNGANTAVGAGANAFSAATIAGANTAVGGGANNYLRAIIAGANTAVGAGANAFSAATIAGANSAVGTGANNYLRAIIAGANTAVGAGANNFTIATLNGANTAARDATNLTSGTVPSARITGVGTLTSGIWNAGTIPVLYGGTGQTTIGGIQGALGLASMAYQASSSVSISGGSISGLSSLAVSGAITATDDITAFSSDARLKGDIQTITNALAKVKSITGITYIHNDLAKSFGYTDENRFAGVLAQEIEAVLPEVVVPAPFDVADDGTSKSGENYKTVKYDKIVSLLIEAIKELSSQVESMKLEIEELKK
jgi:hypothetical protein